MKKLIYNSNQKYKPSKEEKYMNKDQLKYFETKLNSWKEQLLTTCNKTLNILQESTIHKNDPNDVMVSDINVDLELQTKGRYKKLIEKIDKALMKIKTGEYGYCTKTGSEIGIDRLEARPIANLCIEAQQEQELYKKSHSFKNN
ncbi:MAG: RNA polymerase-binding protein DksA [Rickettsia sp.]|nr:RNA polymerase-binding protein DksA [Rickettsia sp.]